MRPVASGIAGGLLLSLVVVAGLALLSGAGPSEGSNFIVGQPLYAVSATTATATMSTSTTVAATIAGPPAWSADKSAINASISTLQTKSSYPALLTILPVAAALALGASAYLISRSRLEKET